MRSVHSSPFPWSVKLHFFDRSAAKNAKYAEGLGVFERPQNKNGEKCCMSWKQRVSATGRGVAAKYLGDRLIA